MIQGLWLKVKVDARDGNLSGLRPGTCFGAPLRERQTSMWFNHSILHDPDVLL